jgi:hypothetical protein
MKGRSYNDREKERVHSKIDKEEYEHDLEAE